jgi:hypothetical protein
LIELFEEFVKREKLKISLLLEEHNMHEFSRHDVMNFLSSEILDPAFANNKLVLIQSVHDNIKEFLLEVDLTKIVNFEVALSFIEKSIQKYNFKVTLRKLHNAMLDEKNTLGLFIIPEKPEIEEIHESQTKYPNLRPSPTKPEISRQPSQSPNPVKRIS